LKSQGSTISPEDLIVEDTPWDDLIAYAKNGEVIIPACVSFLAENSRVPYPAIGDFGISGAYGENSYTVLRSKFNNLGLRKSPKMTDFNELSRVMVSLPMHEKRRPDCGMIRATGQYKVTENYDGEGNGYGFKAVYQKRACHCSACEECGEKNILDDAWLYSQDINARVLGLKMCGIDAHVYEWVFSPPQATQEEYIETCKASAYKEGLQDFERLISFVVRNATEDLDALATGWSTFYHPCRQNGKDGKHREWDGNDDDPFHWRYAPHFHVIVVSRFKGPALIKRLNKLKEEYPFLKGWSIIIGPNRSDKKKGIRAPHEIKDRHELEGKIAYILSHASIKQGVDDDGEPEGRRAPMVSHYGLNHYRRMSRLTLKASVPLLSQGYEETIEENGKELPVYWANYYYECVARNKSLYYAHVERILSAHVYVFNFDKEGARRDITELVDKWASVPGNMEQPERLLSAIYQFIRNDQRYIFDFVPQEGKELRYPYRLYLKSGERDLWNLITSDDGLEYDLRGELPEDPLTEGRINPPEGAGKGPAVAGGSPSGNVVNRAVPDLDDWRDGLDDYALRFAGGRL